MDFAKRVALQLKKYRTITGITQLELSERCGVSEKYYSLLELGKSMGSLEVYHNIAKVFGITLDQLIQDAILPEDEEYAKIISNKIISLSPTQRVVANRLIDIVDDFNITDK